MVERKAMVDCDLKSIPHDENLHIRTVGIVSDLDKSGTFTISDKGGTAITCLPSPDFNQNISNGDLVVIVAKALPTDQGGIELRVESAEKISEKEYLDFDKYLNIRRNLLNYGNRNL